MKKGVVHGRFQPLHLGHMEYIIEAKKKCDFLYIGLANPNPSLTEYNQNNPNRSKNTSNPFYYFERQIMIRNSLLDEGISKHDFQIVPFPINFPNLIKYYVPLDSKFYITIYDKWGYEKINILSKIDVNVEVLWVRDSNTRITSGTEIRNAIKKGLMWKHLVPKEVYKYINSINQNDLINRITHGIT